MNGFEQRLTLLRCAAGEEEGESVINSFPRYLGASTLDPGVAERFSQRISGAPTPQTIKLVPLSAILDQVGVSQPDLIKIDVEGYEQKVLIGALDYLDSRPTLNLLMEWHPDVRSKEDSEMLLDLLTQRLRCQISAVQPDGSTQEISRESLMAIGHADLWAHR